LFESKLSLDDDAHEQVVCYLHYRQHFYPEASASSVFFDHTAFQVFRSKDVGFRVEKVK